MANSRENLDTRRILAEGTYMSNDTWQTGINNNDLIIGPSGAGKTRGYVKPNIMQANESMIVADTKGTLYHEMGDFLRKRGYRVLNIDTKNVAGSSGYNPLDFVRRDPRTGEYSEQDIMTMCTVLSPMENKRDPFWDHAGKATLCALVGYALECLPPEEHTLATVLELFSMPLEDRHRLFQNLAEENPNSFASRQYQMMLSLTSAKVTLGCVNGMLGEKLSAFAFSGAKRMFSLRDRIDFRTLGREKTAVFFNVSDTDRSMDRLSNLFYTQALQTLCDSADNDYPDHRLKVPVRIFLDDFATNVFIPDFDKIISVIRSREIYVSVILQSISQLDSLYGKSAACTILNNCDNCLYLGGQDVDTARYIGVKANCRPDSILNMPLGDAYLFTRGSRPHRVNRFELTHHERYGELMESREEMARGIDPA